MRSFMYAVLMASVSSVGASAQPAGNLLNSTTNILSLPGNLLTFRETGARLDGLNALTRPAVIGDYGHGFDSVTGRVLQKTCVRVTSLEPKSGPIAAPTGGRQFHEVSNVEQIRSESKTSGGASLLYDAFSASANGSMVNGSFSNSFGRYITAYQEIVTAEYIVRGEGQNGDVLLTGPAQDDLKLGPRTFRASCGDHFVSGYRLGGTLNVVASVKANIDKDWKANEENVKVGFADIFGANFSNSSNYSKIRSSASFDVRDLSSGVLAQAVSLENLKLIYEAYQQTVVANPGVIGFTFAPYTDLGGDDVKKIPDFSALEGAKLEELANKRDQARRISNDLETANNSAGLGFDYFTIDGKPGTDAEYNKAAESARKDIDDYFAVIAKAVDVCRFASEAKVCTDAISNDVGAVPPNRVKRKPAP